MAKQDAVPRRTVHGTAPVIAVGSGKGGTGKSTVSLGVADHLRRRGTKVIIVEMDTSNADVAKCYHPDKMPPDAEPQTVVPIDFEKPEAWMDLVDLCARNPDATVLVNTKGGNVKEIRKSGRKLNDALQLAGRPVIGIWVLNLYRDSVIAMREFYKVMPQAEMHAFLNEVWGSREEFDAYHRSTIKATIEKNEQPPEDPVKEPSSSVKAWDDDDEDADVVFDEEGKFERTHVFPRVANRILKRFFDRRRSLEAQMASRHTGYAARIEIEAWRKAIGQVFAKVLS